MKVFRFKSILKFYLLLILTAMTRQGFTQEILAHDDVKTSAGVVEMNFVGHGSLMFNVGGFIIHVDPVRSYGNYNDLPKADLILVTHEHSDHLDASLIKDLSKNGTVIFCNRNSAKNLPNATVMKAGDTQEVKSIVVEAVPAYNIVNERAPGKPFHPKGEGLGYILNIGGKRIYIAGDTENTPEMKALKNIDIAFLPMNLPYTMTPAMVADAAKAFRPKILYPYHTTDTKTDEILNLLKDSGIEVRIRNLK
jgi:L-ascorbate metabolism protein UlaG (beta-lactamase superfamily)